MKLLQRLAEFKRHADAGQSFKRIRAIRLLGVYDGISRRQDFRRTVMVCDNNIHPPRRFRHFLHTTDTAVHRDDKGYAQIIQRLQRFTVKTVAFPFPFGNIGTDIGKLLFQIQI